MKIPYFSVVLVLLASMRLSFAEDLCTATTNLCKEGCCSKSGYCGLGPDFCGFVFDLTMPIHPPANHSIALDAKAPVNVNLSAIRGGPVQHLAIKPNILSMFVAASKNI
jgi:hypothetical protein